MLRLLAALCLIAGAGLSARSAEFTLLCWNVESDFPGSGDPHDGDNAAIIAAELEELVSGLDAGIVGLVEVRPANFLRYRSAVQEGLGGGDVDFVSSASGDHDSMIIVIDADCVRRVLPAPPPQGVRRQPEQARHWPVPLAVPAGGPDPLHRVRHRILHGQSPGTRR